MYRAVLRDDLFRDLLRWVCSAPGWSARKTQQDGNMSPEVAPAPAQDEPTSVNQFIAVRDAWEVSMCACVKWGMCVHVFLCAYLCACVVICVYNYIHIYALSYACVRVCEDVYVHILTMCICTCIGVCVYVFGQ